MQLIKKFLKGTQYESYNIELASADASFRRYFRIKKDDKTLLVMDASKEKESLKPFLNVTKKLLDSNVKAPHIYYEDLKKGFLVIEDFGTTDLLSTLDESNFQKLYKVAIDEIIKMQECNTDGLPLYDDEFLKFEMALMQEWFLKGLMRLELDEKDKQMIQDSLEIISSEVLKQPQGYFVHRDFHSRNIMYIDEKTLGVIDYQDAMNGALTYDLVSLLRDLYIYFEPQKIEELALYFRDRKAIDVSDEEFIRWFDFMGLQRHIKVLGIFARLYLRDGKDGYLKDLPLTLKYVLDVSKNYDELKPLNEFLFNLTVRG